MTLGRNPGASPSRNRRNRLQQRRAQERAARRQFLLEKLEDRVLLAVGPQLIGVQPNRGSLLVDGDTRNIAPLQLTFRFDEGQAIDTSTLDGVRLTRSNFDDIFDDGDDVIIAPGFIGLGESSQEVVMRFATTLPDDLYRIEIFNFDDDPQGITALRNINGDPFEPNDPQNLGLDRETIEFELDLGAQVIAVVPQPVELIGGGAVSQIRDRIDVYFNNDDLDMASATNPSFYQLVRTHLSTEIDPTVRNTDDMVFTPDTVVYDPIADKAELTFSADLSALAGLGGAGTFRLRIGTDENFTLNSMPTTLNPPDTPSTFAGAPTIAINNSTIISAAITEQGYSLQFPGANDEPGHRLIEVDDHLGGGPDFSPSITTQAYNFRPDYGVDPQGNPLQNAITPEQKQRAREIFQIYGELLGIDFVETATSGLTIVTGDLRALAPDVPTGPGGVGGIAGSGVAIMDNGENWDNRFGAGWFTTAMHEIGHLLGQGHTYELPPNTIQGDEAALGTGSFPGTGTEADFPGDHDITHLQHMHRPDATDIDMYRFVVGSTGLFTAETIAERQANSSLLDSNLRLYRENADGSRTLVGKNDDYFSEDSFLKATLSPGTYYIGVSAAGNEDYDPEVPDSGIGGVSEGNYDLRLTFRPDVTDSIIDTTGVALDGDADGIAGGVYNFWFLAQDPANTLFVNKAAQGGGDGSAATPFNNIQIAFAAAAPGDIVRIVGNGGGDGILSTVGDNLAYEIGQGTLPGQILQDGAEMNVPQGVTVMVDAGAVFKLRGARVGVGSSTLGVDRSKSALQVLGTPENSVIFTSWLDETIGVDTNPLETTPGRGDWGGLSYRNEVDRDEERFDYERRGVFLNYVNHADIRYGGGIVNVDGVTQVINPIHMTESRPTVSFNTITQSADAAMSADPNSFEETNFHAPFAQRNGAFTSDYDRVGPDIHGNRILDNSSNGLFARILTPSGQDLKALTVSGRFDDIDIVLIIQENLKIQGTPGGPIIEQTVPPVALVTLTPLAGGTLTAGTYNYRMTYVDGSGSESAASGLTSNVVVGPNGRVLLANLPTAPPQFVARRLYRSDNTGAGPHELVAELNTSSTSFLDTGTTQGGVLGPGPPQQQLARQDARLAIDPSAVVKLEGGRIETTMGAQFIAEGLEGQEIIFTSRLDDRYGAGGTFDTNNDGDQDAPAPGDWGGFYVGHTSSVNIDHALVTFAGGINRVEGSFAGFNALEIHQANARVANSVFENNASGVGGQAPGHRFGRGSNAPATIFVRTAQPALIDNIIRDGGGAAININANALSHVLRTDLGRETGPVDRLVDFRDNQGPLVRLNRLVGNDLNGMQVRGEVLTAETVWDDADIVHIVRNEIVIPDFHTFGGLRIQSDADESLVVKLDGGSAGFTATGRPLDIDDRIGGSLQIIGLPGRPVIMTSLFDDTVGAGFQPNGQPLVDTGNDGAAAPTPGDWRSIRLQEFSHDRNVETIVELEPSSATDSERNATPGTAQFLGELATGEKSSDDNLRLGFEIHGFINSNDDVDVYSFQATAGMEVWFDVDLSTHALDSVVEIINANGTLVARSVNSGAEQLGAGSLFAAPNVDVNPLLNTGFQARDFYTTNPRDAGMRVVLPGAAGAGQTTYYVRIRSNSGDLTDLAGGESNGVYQLQVRLSELDEVPGSTVRYADIRFATNGVEVLGLPQHSPLLGESAEGTSNNDSFGAAQDLGAVTNSDRAAISVAGNILAEGDVDFYEFSVSFDSIQSIAGFTAPEQFVPVVIDLDYSDGLARGDLAFALFDSTGALIMRGTDSNVSDDRPGPGQGADIDDLSRGSVGPLDPFIGPIELPVGDYVLAVHNVSRVPQALNQFLVSNSVNSLIRMEPVVSVERIAEDRISGSGGSNVASGPVVPVLFDSSSVVPFTLNDVNLFVSRGSGLVGNNRSSIYTVDPFTGGYETVVGQFGPQNGDIVMRADGELFTFSTGPASGNPSDGNTGNYLLIDTGTAAVASQGDDGVSTFRDDPNNAGLNVQGHNVGVAYEAIAYSGTAQFSGFVVGNRNSSAGNSAINRASERAGDKYDRNILYNFDINNGAARSVPNLRTDNPRVDFAGTDVRERGRLRTLTELEVNNAEQGDTFTITIDGNPLPVVITGPGVAGDPVTANAAIAQIVTAFNNSVNPVFQNFQAGTSADLFIGQAGGVVDSVMTIALINPAGAFSNISTSTANGPDVANVPNQSLTSIGFGPGGDITGMTFISGQAYAVTDTGGLFTISTAGTGLNQNRASYIPASAADLLTNGNGGASGIQIDFQGLTVGPNEVEGGAFANTLFGASDDGELFAFDTSGVLQTIFVDNATSVQMVNEFGTPLSNVTGLDFGTLDRNLWHITGNRGNDAGHGIDETFDQTRASAPGGSSFYFGNERAGSTAGNKNDLGRDGRIRDVNFPGGAHGSLVSNEFDLSEYAPEDLPALYFNYFLDTENTTYNPNPLNPMRDAFRVYVGTYDGDWSLVGTNNSFRDAVRADEFDIGPFDTFCTAPVTQATACVQELFDDTGGWRQGRIDLAPFAGLSNLRLRFDFSTAASLDIGQPATGGDELRAVNGVDLRDGQIFSIDGDTFEFDLGFTLIAQAGAVIPNGEQFTVDGDTYQFHKSGPVPANPIFINDALTSIEVATAIAAALGGVVSPPVLGPDILAESALTSNDTFDPDPLLTNAHQSGLPGGAASWSATGNIGDNPAVLVNLANDVDLIEITVSGPSDNISIDVDADELGSSLDSVLILFDDLGNIVPGGVSDDDAAPTEPPGLLDPFINISGLVAGTYYVGVSAFSNFAYDPTVFGTASGGLSTGSYEIFIDVTGPPAAFGVFRDGNRINIPDATTVATNFAILPVEGAPGAVGTPDQLLAINSGMNRNVIAGVVQQALADEYAGGETDVIKRPGAKDLIRVIGHVVTNQGPLGLENSLAGESFGAFDAAGVPGASSPPTRFAGSLRGINNTGEGAYIDDIIIGFAERGETVVNGVAGQSGFIQNPELLASTLAFEHTSILVGPYDVEIRRAAEYAVVPEPVPTSPPINFPVRAFDTNGRLLQGVSLAAPSAAEIADGETFTVSDGVNTMTFEYDDVAIGDGVAPGNVLIPFNSAVIGSAVGVLDIATQSSSEIARAIRDAINSQAVQLAINVTAGIGDGTNSGDGTGAFVSGNNIVNLYGGTIVGDHTDHASFFDFGVITPIVHGQGEHGFVGDQNHFRDQGQVLIHSNIIRDSAQWGVVADAGARGSSLAPDAGPLPHTGPVRNTQERNNDRLTPGVVIENNLVVGGGAGGIQLQGENQGAALGQGAVPYYRVVNNTIYGDETPRGVGIAVSDNASPTLLNNITAGLATGISIAGNSSSTIIGGAVFQNNNNNVAGAGLGDFPLNLGPGAPLFVNAAAGNFYPETGSLIIDSSIDSLEDRTNLVEVKSPLGIGVSPILAPQRDVTGQLRVDDPDVPTPVGLGGNVFVDRGAIDRSDFNGPNAVITNPRDNDIDGLDLDGAVSVVRRADGAFSNFEIQLFDGNDPSDPLDGIGVDDLSVLQQTTTIFRDDVFLQQGIDYNFSYNATSQIIRLTPLSGIWAPGAYVIALNNVTQFKAQVLGGEDLTDGDIFRIVDAQGNDVTFEFESGFSIHVPETLTIQTPAAGGGPGGVDDGDTFTIDDGNAITTFEFDSDDTPNDPNAFVIEFSQVPSASTQLEVSVAIATALNGAGLGIEAKALANGFVHVGAPLPIDLDLTNSPNLAQSGQAGLLLVGQEFLITNGGPLVPFALGSSVPFQLSNTYEELADSIVTAISNSSVGLSPTHFGQGRIHVGGGPQHLLDTSTTGLSQIGEPGVTGPLALNLPEAALRLQIPAGGGHISGIIDGETFTIDDGIQAVTFEFDRDSIVNGTNVPIPFSLSSSPDSIATEIENAVTGEVTAGNLIGVTATNLGNGVVGVAGGLGVALDTSGSPNLLRPYRPGDLIDQEIFTIFDGSQTVVFEFDRDGNSTFGNVIIPFANVNTATEIADAMVVAINGAGLGLSAVNQGNGVVTLGETAAFDVDVSQSSLTLTGVPGGATASVFIPDASFDQLSVAAQVLTAIDNSALVDVDARLEGSTIAVRGATNVIGLSSQVVDPIVDEAQNPLNPNQPDGETRFTVLLGDFELDLGDAPTAAQSGFAASYPTTQAQNGARHVLVDTGQLILGVNPLTDIDADPDGQPTDGAVGDDNDGNDDEDGVNFVGLLNQFVDTDIEVTANGVGVLDAWIDANFDGDWDDPGEQVISNEAVLAGVNNKTFRVPLGAGIGDTYMRFRISSSGGTLPTGIVVNGEVEDYEVTIIAGTPPVANDDGPPAAGFTVSEDDELDSGANLLDNDFDVDTSPTPPANAVAGIGLSQFGAEVEVRADGTFRYDPRVSTATALQALGIGEMLTDTFTYLADDGMFESLTPGTVSILVTGENDAPTAVADDLMTDEDTPIFVLPADIVLDPSLSLTFNDFDIDGDSFTGIPIVSGSSTLGAAISVAADGSYSYDPTGSTTVQGLAVGETATDTFTYTIEDINGAQGVGTVSIELTGVNDAPNPGVLSFNSDEDTIIADAIDLNADPDFSDNPLAITPFSGFSAEGAGVEIFLDGTFTYDPTASSSLQQLDDADPPVADAFTYTLNDGNGGIVTSTVTVNVQGLNDAPLVNNDNYVTDEDTLLVVNAPGAGLLSNDSDPDLEAFNVLLPNPSMPFTFLSLSGGAEVTLNIDGTFTYNPTVPSAGVIQSLAIGEIFTDTFTYAATDGDANSLPATATITVVGRNDAPTANDETHVDVMEDDGPVTRLFPAFDVDNDAPPILSIVITSTPSEGSVINNVDGTFTFNPNAGADFQDLGPGETRTVEFTYEATDQHGATSALGTISFEVGGENDAPIAVNDNAGSAADSFVDIDVLTNDTDVDGTLVPSTVSVASGPSFGAAVVNPDGTITYTPNGGFIGSDTFTYTVDDNDGATSNEATVTVFVAFPPVADNDDVQIIVNTPTPIVVLANDSDPDGSLNPATVNITSGPANGTAVVIAGGQVLYTPNANYLGPDSFTYTVDDQTGLTSNEATVTITVVLSPTPYTNPNNPLDVNDDGFVAPDDALILINFINLFGPGFVLPNPPGPPVGPPPPYLDPTGDNIVAPDDPFAVINFIINPSPPPQGEGEGELIVDALEESPPQSQEWAELLIATAPAPQNQPLAAPHASDDDGDLLAVRSRGELSQGASALRSQSVIDDVLPSLSARKRSFQELDIDDLLCDIADDVAETRGESAPQDLAVNKLWN